MVKDPFDKNADKKCLDDFCSDENPMEWIEIVNNFAVADVELQRQIFCGHEENEDLLEDRLWQYAQGHMDESIQSVFWEKIRDCNFCLSRLAKMLRSLEIAYRSPQWHSDRVRAMVGKNRGSQMVHRLLDRFKHVVSSIAEDRASQLGRLVDDLKTTFIESFTYPTPCFSPVFGESRFAVIGPYGKVRYPIVFEWRPHEKAYEYVLRIDELNKVYRTTETKLVVEAGTCEIVDGEEYMWELAVHGEDEILTEEYGFFSFAGEDALRDIQLAEEAFGHITGGMEENLLMAGLLEKSGFFMEAVDRYTTVYEQEPLAGIAYRIACCYDQLELDELRADWNRKIPVEEPD